MDLRTDWRPALAALLLALAIAPSVAHAFPESTETQGEIPGDLNGVWLVVHRLTFDRPTPQPTPGAEAPSTKRVFNVLNLWKIVHLKKDQAQATRDAKDVQLKSSIAKAEAMIAKEKAAAGATGTLEPRVVVPQVPRPPGYDPSAAEGDQVEIFLLDVPMPKSIDEALQAAQKAEKAFEPTPEQLALLGSSWQTLEPRKDTEYSRIEWKVVAEKFFDQAMKVDPNLKDATISITGTQAMIPRPTQPDRNIVMYGLVEQGEKTISGKHARAMMATAPFPIPIEMKGTFEMFKVADLPQDKSKPAAEAAKDKAP
jgi:hypothetical protein